MKTKTMQWIVVSMLIMASLAGCSRYRGPSNQLPIENGMPVSPTAAESSTVTMVTSTMEATQAQDIQATQAPTQTNEIQPQPTSTTAIQSQPGSDADITQLSSDILKSLDELSKGLDSTDTMTDVK